MAFDTDWHDRQIEEAFPRAWPWLFLGRLVMLAVIVVISVWSWCR